MEKQLNMPQPPPTDHPADALWQKIENFQLDDPTATFPFSRKLASENDWDETFAREAIKEYKRFVYLCCISPDGASPSPIVDEVWHLHLCYTVNYWEEFCEKTLCRKLHHHPSNGGEIEHKKHNDWYQRTLNLYRQTFNEDPPPHIWLKKSLKPKESLITRKLKAIFNRRQGYLSALPLAIFPLISGCKNGEPFFSPLVFIGVMIILNNFASKENRDKQSSGDGGNSCGGSSCGSSCGGGCGGGGCGGCGS